MMGTSHVFHPNPFFYGRRKNTQKSRDNELAAEVELKSGFHFPISLTGRGAPINHGSTPHQKPAASFSAALTSDLSSPTLHTLVQGVPASVSEGAWEPEHTWAVSLTISFSHQEMKAQRSSETGHSKRMRECLNEPGVPVSFSGSVGFPYRQVSGLLSWRFKISFKEMFKSMMNPFTKQVTTFMYLLRFGFSK